MTKGFFLFFFANLIALDAFASQQDLSLSPQWLKLVHYKPTLGGNFVSESRPSEFFLHPEGHRQPQAELYETLKQIENSPLTLGDEHPACRFPGRRIFLENSYPNLSAKLSDLKCTEYNKFQDRLQARALSLVFSSYYLDTPASAFGHTLLRFSKNPNASESERFELLDYAANYAAVVTTGNAFLYAVLGMFGGFWGEFAVMPYFYKVREYNDFESRDIWDYELNLTPEQLEMVIAHLWELKQARFPYFYLKQNCSYHMLAILEAAHPELNLLDQLPPFVLPVDTIRVVAQTEGLVRTVRYRPSKRKILEARLQKLSADEQKLVRESLKNKTPDLLLNSGPEQVVKMLDTALDSIDFLHPKEIVREDPEVLGWKRQFLLARSRQGVATDEIQIELPVHERPEIGHKSSRLALSIDYDSRRGTGFSLENRFALHDFLDPLQGHNPGSSMEMGRFKLRVIPEDKVRQKSSRVWIDDIALVEVRSLSPISPFFRKMSWRAFLGAKTLRDKIYEGNFAPTADFGYGPSFRLGSRINLTAFVHGGLHINSRVSPSHLLPYIGPELMFLYRAHEKLNIIAFGKISYYALSKELKRSHEYGLRSKILVKKNLALDAQWISRVQSHDSSIGLSLYY
jgi:hypothetical protein